MKLIPPAELHFNIGKCVHVMGAPVGCVWILDSIKGGKAHLITPKTRKRKQVSAHKIYYTKRNEPQE